MPDNKLNQENIDLQKHIADGAGKIIQDAVKATLRDPKQSAFFARFAVASAKAARTRMALEEKGEHVPAFLIASITSRCNLHCAGCYARGLESATDDAPVDQLTGEQWKKIFEEARELGVSFIMLAGGEPMIRRDVIDAAGDIPEILFPIFTNGTFFNDEYRALFDRCRNLVPVLSIEGGMQVTDARRGQGMYGRLLRLMDDFHEKRQLFGASVTVTTRNYKEVTSPEFMDTLISRGCRLIIYVEYVPTRAEETFLAPGEAERVYLAERIDAVRSRQQDVILLSFPGDELAMGGCMAGGREFFHINSHGGAEPCPFSPYSDINVAVSSLREALNSPLFRALRENGLLEGEHSGGCVLFEKRDQVAALLQR
ncbi:MAG: radical SAM protein [Firmicutes bacterium]|nr:radical SAM protein [Bacillota bacterium]